MQESWSNSVNIWWNLGDLPEDPPEGGVREPRRPIKPLAPSSASAALPLPNDYFTFGQSIMPERFNSTSAVPVGQSVMPEWFNSTSMPKQRLLPARF